MNITNGENKMVKSQCNKRSSVLLIAALMAMLMALGVASVDELSDTTPPTIVQVTPANDQVSVSTHDALIVQFSEPMDPSTINENTFTVVQRTTPATGSPSIAYRSMQLEGTITYDGNIATFTPKASESYNPMQPSQEHGNVFTVTITSGAKDIAGNPLSRDYVWSFTTGANAFNTGASTSQSDQSASLITGAVAAPTPVAAVPAVLPAAIPAATGSWLNSMWFIGGILLLLLIALILMLSIRAERQKNIQKTSYVDQRADPFGDVHPVADLEGIGPAHKRSLATMGIKNTHQLWKANAAKVAYRTGAPLSSVRSWQNMAELCSIKGIGPQYAELLERSNIHSISQLKNSDPDKVLSLIREKQDSLDVNIQGNSPGYTTVQNWIEEARDHRYAASEV